MKTLLVGLVKTKNKGAVNKERSSGNRKEELRQEAAVSSAGRLDLRLCDLP